VLESNGPRAAKNPEKKVYPAVGSSSRRFVGDTAYSGLILCRVVDLFAAISEIVSVGDPVLDLLLIRTSASAVDSGLCNHVVHLGMGAKPVARRCRLKRLSRRSCQDATSDWSDATSEPIHLSRDFWFENSRCPSLTRIRETDRNIPSSPASLNGLSCPSQKGLRPAPECRRAGEYRPQITPERRESISYVALDAVVAALQNLGCSDVARR